MSDCCQVSVPRPGCGELRPVSRMKGRPVELPVCYCFGVSESSIRAEIQTTGRSDATERVRAHIAAGRCACEVRNPRGACCLGDVATSVTRVKVELSASAVAVR